MNKLKIGVLLKDYKKHEGGAYSYYNALVEAIESYKFDEDLEFVFIVIGNSIDPSAPKKSYLFDPEKSIKKKHLFIHLLNSVAKTKLINYLPISVKIEASYKKRYSKCIKEQLIENGIDLVYSLTPFYLDLDYPTVITHWDIGHKSTFTLPETIYNGEYESRKEYYEKTLPKAFAICCESEAGKKELCHYDNINPQRVHIIPMFPGTIVDLKLPKEEQTEILENFGLNEKDFFIYPAQFWPHKNHYNLLMSFKTFNDNYPGTKLILSGSDKGNLSYIKSLTRELGLQESVLFPGFIKDAELFTFYRNAISLVMPTLMGPTNMPPIEAHALGCRIICTDFPGHRESLAEEAIYISNPLDRVEIFKALEKCYLEKNTYSPQSTDHATVNDALEAINTTFLGLSAIRKTFPLNPTCC
jgi:glycosyltransferase involved in cell wall biosynthesis